MDQSPLRRQPRSVRILSFLRDSPRQSMHTRRYLLQSHLPRTRFHRQTLLQHLRLRLSGQPLRCRTPHQVRMRRNSHQVEVLRLKKHSRQLQKQFQNCNNDCCLCSWIDPQLLRHDLDEPRQLQIRSLLLGVLQQSDRLWPDLYLLEPKNEQNLETRTDHKANFKGKRNPAKLQQGRRWQHVRITTHLIIFMTIIATSQRIKQVTLQHQHLPIKQRSVLRQ